MQSIQLGQTEEQLAALCRALSHPLRVGILRYIVAHPGAICNDIVVRTDRAQSTISGHLRVLTNAGLLECEADGQASSYWVAPDALQILLQAVETLNTTHREGNSRRVVGH